MAGPFILDRAPILERLGGDEDIYAMMVDMFLGDVDNNCAALAEAFAGGDVEGVQRQAHTIKGLLATFSDDEGAAEALVIEKKAKTGELASLDEGVAYLQGRLREVAKVLGGG